MPQEPTLLVTTIGIRDHFRDQVLCSLSRQQVSVQDHTAGYLVDLLTTFTDPHRLFSDSPEGLELRTLASHYADAAHAEGAEQRKHALKTLGDLALFISGVFSGYLNRRLVDVDYYIAMGCGAYRDLHDFISTRLSVRVRRTLAQVPAARRRAGRRQRGITPRRAERPSAPVRTVVADGQSSRAGQTAAQWHPSDTAGQHSRRALRTWRCC